MPEGSGFGVRTAYSLLMAAFGPQGWWPVGWDKPLYRPGFYGPLLENEIFEICAGAILTQNTAWKNVEKALAALGGADTTSAEKTNACPTGKLGRIIRSSGYYRQKAGRLKSFCGHILRKHPEGLNKWFSASDRAALRAELLSLKGIGPETADSIALYAAGKLCFVIDAYTRRIGQRLGIGGDLPYEGWQEFFQANLPPNVRMYNEYHALLVKLGKDFCKKRETLCDGCPLRKMCNSRK